MVTENKQNTKPKKPKKVNNLRHAEYYDMQETFDGLFAKSSKGEAFDNLMDLIFSRDNILLAYRNIKRNDGSVTPGTDGLTMRDIEKIHAGRLSPKSTQHRQELQPAGCTEKRNTKAKRPEQNPAIGYTVYLGQADTAMYSASSGTYLRSEVQRQQLWFSA
jgi:hypothetical protein